MLCRIWFLFIQINNMHTVNRKAIVRHNAKEMFDLVNNVESYPEFLKWCYSSHIVNREGDQMTAGLSVSLVGIKQKFTTKNILNKLDKNYKIYLNLVEGPFEHLSGYWNFIYLEENASKIELHLEFNFKSGLLNSAFKRAFGKIIQQLVSDFVKRANDVYH